MENKFETKGYEKKKRKYDSAKIDANSGVKTHLKSLAFKRTESVL